METDIWNVEETKIAPQRFDTGILLAIFDIAGIDYCSVAPAGKVVYIMFWTTLAHLLLFFFFRKYLQNFKSSLSIYWINWAIGINIILTVFYASLSYRLGTLYYQHGIEPTIVFIVLAVASITITSIFGYHLTRIKNDTIGLLAILGSCFLFIIPIAELFTGLLPFITQLARQTFEQTLYYGSALKFIRTIAYNIPPAIMMLIFVRAKRRLQPSDNHAQ